MYKVLIVDDEKYICQLILHLVHWEDLGLQVIGMANHSDEALRLMHIENPDIIITDICMPDCDGLSLVKQIKQESPDTAVIFISGYRDFEYVQQALKSEAADYLLKPIKKHELISVLNKVVAGKETQALERMELAAIKSEIVNMKEKLHSVFVRDAIFTQKFSDGAVSMEEINREHHSHISHPVFIVLLIRLDYEPPLFQQDIGALTNDRLLSLLDQFFPDEHWQKFMSVINEYMYVIVNSDAYDEVKSLCWKVIFEDIGANCGEKNIHVTIGISPAVQGLDRVRHASELATEAMKDRCIFGVDRVIEAHTASFSLDSLQIDDPK